MSATLFNLMDSSETLLVLHLSSREDKFGFGLAKCCPMGEDIAQGWSSLDERKGCTFCSRCKMQPSTHSL